MPKKAKPGLVQLQAMANEYARQYVSTTNLGIPPHIEEAQFTPLMDGIMKALVNAWAAGYKAGTER